MSQQHHIGFAWQRWLYQGTPERNFTCSEGNILQKPWHAVKTVTWSTSRTLGDEQRKHVSFNLVKVKGKARLQVAGLAHSPVILHLFRWHSGVQTKGEVFSCLSIPKEWDGVFEFFFFVVYFSKLFHFFLFFFFLFMFSISVSTSLALGLQWAVTVCLCIKVL